MKHLMLPIFISCQLILSGCQSFSNVSTTQSSQSTYKQKFLEADAVASSCVSSVLSSPVGKTVSEQIIFLTKDDKNLLELMSSSDRLSFQQKLTLKDYLTQNLKCRQDFFNSIKDTPYHDIFSRYFKVMDDVYIKLMDDQMTIGEANLIKSNAIQLNIREVEAIR